MSADERAAVRQVGAEDTRLSRITSRLDWVDILADDDPLLAIGSSRLAYTRVYPNHRWPRRSAVP